MNQADIIDSITDRTNITKADAKRALNAVVDCVTTALRDGSNVIIPGLGTFGVTQRAARNARNLHTGETIAVPAKKVPKFTPAKALKDATNR